MTFDITAPEGTLATFIGSVETLVDESKLRASEDGLSMTAVDPANVALADVDVTADAFDSFAVSGGPVIGVNLTRLADVVGMGDDSWRLETVDRKIMLRSGGLEYTLATIDPDSIRAEPDLPDLDLPVEIDIEWRRMERAITAADMVSDHLAMGTGGGDSGIFVTAEGDTDDVNETISADELEGEAVAGEVSVQSKFSIDYLKTFSSAIPADEVATIQIGDEFPTVIQWETGGIDVTYQLAPRITSD